MSSTKNSSYTKKPEVAEYKPTAEYKARVAAASYIGRKGYTIPKSELDPADLAFLYKDLYMIPVKNGPSFGVGDADTDAFPVYRENSNKIYIPRFYGIDRYGRPSRDEICTAGKVEPIRNVPFVKQLRDYQIEVINTFLDATERGTLPETRGGILQLGCGMGKCLAKNTEILMYDGTIKLVQDILVGDLLMGDDSVAYRNEFLPATDRRRTDVPSSRNRSTPRTVLSLARGRETMYKVHDEDGGKGYTVNESHILSLKNENGHIWDVSVLDYLDYLNKYPEEKDNWFGYRIQNDLYPVTYRIHLEKLPEDDYYGFEIDGNRRFVLGDFTVTHNTVMSINIISQIAQKTLVIVHKEFLLNQWIERIAEFCPKATIGRIQGTKFDVEGKDIVIGMLQTIYDRDFPEGTFDQFGLTIVDEVHRIGSCQFSRALLRVQTPVMLGVTATLERKDGLTRVIHHFMGPIIYQQAATVDRTEFEHVLVRGMEFQHRDPDFSKVATDFRGNVQYSTMISKLCGFGPRTAFLVRILRDLIDENPEAQILVLGHTRSLLTELHDTIVDQEITTVGYYLGGMKQSELDRSTERQILLATYAMASEGFDHKNLSILVMITPKTDIVQSVGRIFRTRHDRPIIVDVIDQHDVFKNQWRKRLPYYRKMGYQIQTIESPQYHGFGDPRTVWNTVGRRGGGGAAVTKGISKGGVAEEDIAGKCFIKL